MRHRRQLLFGLYFDPLSMDEVIEQCRNALITRSRVALGVLNAAKIVNLRGDEALRNSLMECDLLLADGQSVVWASRLLGRPLPERVAGIDIFERLLNLAHRENRSIYLLGAKPEVLAALQLRLAQLYPGLRIAGSHHGYFKGGESAEIAEDIRQSGADMLFLGMTSPKKEIFLGAHGPSLDVPILHGVGGSFDILAGLTQRAPDRWQRSGLEWAYRVLQEPRRLWWRYARTNTVFLALTLAELLRPARAFKRSRASAVMQPAE
ncbi:MAG: WecB/TagA/CpsF family glycosyltransferase [Methylobacterium mesophilicum]|nr:WecB/TagA/CpsF family glycosyltransferase [Methylobacterium mesophilicum]